MPIYPRNNRFQVSVGSHNNRYRATFDTEAEAKAAEAAAFLRLKATGSPLEASQSLEQAKPKGYTLKDAHDLAWRVRWCNDKPAGQKTHRIFCKAVFNEFAPDTPLSEINYQMSIDAVESWEEDGNGGQTVNHKISHLSVMLDEAMKMGWLQAKPLLLRRKPGKHRVRWMSEQEELKALNLCRSLGLEELHDLIVIAIDTGFRRGELLGLRPNDYVGGKLHLHEGETKTDKARAVPVTERVAEILNRRSNQRTIFSMSARQLWSRWWDLKSAMDLDDDDQFCVHMLRHTCASRLVQRGVSLPVVKEWMGHSNIQTTMRYAHLAPDSLEAGRKALEQVKAQPVLMVVNG